MMKLFGPDDQEMMAIDSLTQEGESLVVKGRIYGAMPLAATLHPEEARSLLKMLTPRLIWFLITLPFRQRARAYPKIHGL